MNFLAVFLKSIEVLFISSVKFILGAPVSYLNGFGYVQTLIITALGGICGVMFFYYFSRWFQKRIKGMLFAESSIAPKKEGKLATKIRNKYGLVGIIILTPVILSIPIGAILAYKYYSSRKRTPLYLTISVICWSLVMTTLFNFMR